MHIHDSIFDIVHCWHKTIIPGFCTGPLKIIRSLIKFSKTKNEKMELLNLFRVFNLSPTNPYFLCIDDSFKHSIPFSYMCLTQIQPTPIRPGHESFRVIFPGPVIFPSARAGSLKFFLANIRTRKVSNVCYFLMKLKGMPRGFLHISGQL